MVVPQTGRHDADGPLHQPIEEKLEELLSVTLKLDPAGQAGKHRNPGTDAESECSEG